MLEDYNSDNDSIPAKTASEPSTSESLSAATLHLMEKLVDQKQLVVVQGFWY